MTDEGSVQAKRGAFEFGTILAFLTLSTYVLGYLKLAALYAFLDCTWVLKFNSSQDFISQGAVGVSSVVVSALIFGAGKNSIDAIQRSQFVLALAGLVSIFIATVLSNSFAAASLIYDPLMEVLPFFYLGPAFYAFAMSFYDSEFKNARSQYYYLIPVIVIFLIYVHVGSKAKEFTEGLGSTYVVSKASGADKSILIGSVNNKYLVRGCSLPIRYSIIDPGADWVVTPIASAKNCNEPSPSKVKEMPLTNWHRFTTVFPSPDLLPASPLLCKRTRGEVKVTCSSNSW